MSALAAVPAIPAPDAHVDAAPSRLTRFFRYVVGKNFRFSLAALLVGVLSCGLAYGVVYHTWIGRPIQWYLYWALALCVLVARLALTRLGERGSRRAGSLAVVCALAVLGLTAGYVHFLADAGVHMYRFIQVSNALEKYAKDHGTYPETLAECNAGVQEAMKKLEGRMRYCPPVPTEGVDYPYLILENFFPGEIRGPMLIKLPSPPVLAPNRPASGPAQPSPGMIPVTEPVEGK